LVNTTSVLKDSWSIRPICQKRQVRKERLVYNREIEHVAAVSVGASSSEMAEARAACCAVRTARTPGLSLIGSSIVNNPLVQKPMSSRRTHHRIYLVRGGKVMLDSDLAELCGVETKVSNQAIGHNWERVPADVMFRLSS
jgi:hypothetical protein